MNKLTSLLVLIFICSISSFSQESMNDYKYVIVPIQYEFQKSEDQFQINSLIKFLFEKEGFDVYLSTDDLPSELSNNRCLAMTANVLNKKSMFSTKMHFEMKDCNNKVIFTAKEGRNNIKSFDKAYSDAIRKSFEYIKLENYSYTPKEPEGTTNVMPAVATTSVVSNSVDIKDVAPDSNTSVEKTTTSNDTNVNVPVVAAAVVVATPDKKEVDTTVLYAQEIKDGYQIVDSTPKVVYIALRTSVENVYLIKGSDGIIYKSEEGFVAQEYVEGQLVSKVLNIKLLD